MHSRSRTGCATAFLILNVISIDDYVRSFFKVNDQDLSVLTPTERFSFRAYQFNLAGRMVFDKWQWAQSNKSTFDCTI